MLLPTLSHSNTSNATPITVYGLFAASTPQGTRAAALASAAAALAQSLSLPELLAAADGAVEVPSPQSLDLRTDDRINVPSRALLAQGARRSYGDLGDARAVALALGHHAAWLRFQGSGTPLGLFLVEPEGVLPGAAPAAAAAAVRSALGSAGAAWDLLLLGALVPPQQLRPPPPGDAALALAGGWAVPLRWRGWHAYVLTQAGVDALLREGALPLSQRAEAHASALVDLGHLRALALREGGGVGAGAGAGSSGGGAEGAARGAPIIARAEGWGVSSAAGGALAHMLVEEPCDLCAVPEDYSRMGHILLTAGPSAVVAGLLTTFALRATGCGKGVFQ